MPRKPTKSKAETTAENYFPVEEVDVRYAIEKQVKDPVDKKDWTKTAVEKTYKNEEVEIIEKVGKNSPRKTTRTGYTKKYNSKAKSSTRKISSKTKIADYKIPEISLKKSGYELIITEKPQAAMKIADALGKSEKRNASGIPYYEVDRKGKEIVVACAVGHLFTLKQTSNGSLPIFDIKWIPNFLARKGDFTKKYYDTLLKLAKNAGSITIATDYDIEGEVIGMNVMRFICNQKDANRMKYSTLTSIELNQSYENKKPNIDWGQAIAGETRHYLDWFYGINLSRELMNAIKSIGRFKIMSIGRVQGPTLNLIVKKEREIQSFKSTTYWQVFIKVKNSHILELKHDKDITKKEELKKFDNLNGKEANAETKKSQQTIMPLEPFNLTTLQTEAYKFFGFTPSRTLQIAQSLYLNGLISYPRTSSQKLPDSIGYLEILDKLAKRFKVEKFITRNKPIEGKKSDPAHPSIYPTGNFENLSGEEEKLYNLIAKRFLSLFCDNAVIENKTVRVGVDNLTFSTRGSEIQQKGWMEIYPSKIQEKDLPDLNGKVKIINVRNEEKETQPPRRFSPASIISELEKRNLGTKSTRASILETLYDRNYIREKNVEATQLGISLISTLEKYSPIIIDEALTRHFEKEMNLIQESKKDFNKKQEKIIDEAKETITKIIKDMEKNEKNIGNELSEANDNIIQQEREQNTLTQCPVCNKGNLRILYNRNARRYFVACSAYPECKTTFSLPPNSLIKNANEICPACKFPMLLSIRKGKRPWKFCFNQKCPSNKERMEEYNKKKEEENSEQ
ncbi:MAG: DNA topoisomerase I [archaeon]|nr:DNA topoisomerase I [archaeon]